jgi:hypothetical protein
MVKTVNSYEVLLENKTIQGAFPIGSTVISASGVVFHPKL